jgi:hypothetical protein
MFMMKNNIAHKTTYMGAGAGMALFSIFGILPSLIAGGALGLMLADMLFGGTANAETLRRLMAAGGMMLGITLGSAVLVAASSILGWLFGAIIPKRGTEEAGRSDSVECTGDGQEENQDGCHDKKGRGAAGFAPHHA